MNSNEQSYTNLSHPYKWVEMKKQFQQNTEFKIRDIPMERISQIIRLFVPNNSESIAEAYNQFVSVLTTRSEFLDASVIFNGKVHATRNICIKFRKRVKHTKSQSHGKWMNITNQIARYIGEAFEIPVNKVEKEIKLSAAQADRNLFYIQTSDTLVFAALARVGFSFQPVWNKSHYEEEYTAALKSVADKHDLRKIKNDRIATIQRSEGIMTIKRTGSVKSEGLESPIEISSMKTTSISTSALTDEFSDEDTDRSEVVEFTEETHKLLTKHGRGATFQNPMCESNNAFFSLFGLLGFAVDSHVEKSKLALNAKLSFDEKNEIKIEFQTKLEGMKNKRRESSC
ncbi:hypothetical protein LOD99_13067 [Oopsacas minuta]|uniref:Uncharacterized protein n=1 Tax=Oopsacas minuta TaxID=111878 RepID=A0AAV7JAR9_9METZ|nr:hypothetical protein LOD99_13067 [Oopsacas minuta]